MGLGPYKIYTSQLAQQNPEQWAGVVGTWQVRGPVLAHDTRCTDMSILF